jgi:hypothetical protein
VVGPLGHPGAAGRSSSERRTARLTGTGRPELFGALGTPSQGQGTRDSSESRAPQLTQGQAIGTLRRVVRCALRGQAIGTLRRVASRASPDQAAELFGASSASSTPGQGSLIHRARTTGTLRSAVCSARRDGYPPLRGRATKLFGASNTPPLGTRQSGLFGAPRVRFHPGNPRSSERGALTGPAYGALRSLGCRASPVLGSGALRSVASRFHRDKAVELFGVPQAGSTGIGNPGLFGGSATTSHRGRIFRSHRGQAIGTLRRAGR